jgi:hypothetical protein
MNMQLYTPQPAALLARLQEDKVVSPDDHQMVMSELHTVGGATALVSSNCILFFVAPLVVRLRLCRLIVFSFVLLLWWCDCACENVHLCSLLC